MVSSMSAFGVTLESLMKERGFNQADIAAAVFGDRGRQGQISNYLNENRLPEDDIVVRFCTAFRKDAPQIVAAWLRDRTPESLRNLVEVRPVDGGRIQESEECSPAYPRLPRRVQRVIDEVAEKCEVDPRFLAAIETTVKLTRVKS
jgi:transcriptional regulator with XRE-family HTH domain